MATLENFPEANCDRQAGGQTGRMTKPLIGALATALPKKRLIGTQATARPKNGDANELYHNFNYVFCDLYVILHHICCDQFSLDSPFKFRPKLLGLGPTKSFGGPRFAPVVFGGYPTKSIRDHYTHCENYQIICP